MKPVFDLSNLLDKDEIELLGKGLKFGIKNKNFNQFEILTRFEEFAQNMKNEEISKEILKERYETLPIDSFMQKLQSLTYEFLDSAKTPQNSLTFEEEKTLVKLKSKVKDNSLIVTKADKGNATVINKRADYIDKLQKILSDKSKFELIENPNEDLI